MLNIRQKLNKINLKGLAVKLLYLQALMVPAGVGKLFITVSQDYESASGGELSFNKQVPVSGNEIVDVRIDLL